MCVSRGGGWRLGGRAHQQIGCGVRGARRGGGCGVCVSPALLCFARISPCPRPGSLRLAVRARASVRSARQSAGSAPIIPSPVRLARHHARWSACRSAPISPSPPARYCARESACPRHHSRRSAGPAPSQHASVPGSARISPSPPARYRARQSACPVLRGSLLDCSNTLKSVAGCHVQMLCHVDPDLHLQVLPRSVTGECPPARHRVLQSACPAPRASV